MQLTAIETRVLGCLLEKERQTPENYPLSLNALGNACNQSSNRDPLTAYSEKEVDDALLELREKKLATVVFGAGSRVQKYRHNLPDHFELSAQETALLCVLLLRGPQTTGELRIRTERMVNFSNLEKLEAILAGLCEGSEPLVRRLAARPGQKEDRYVQLLSGEPVLGMPESAPRITGAPSRIDQMQAEVTALRDELAALKAEFETFRSQF